MSSFGKKYFGTDGIRGVAGQFPLDVATIEKIGYLLAQQLAREEHHRPHFIIGRDTRESGEWIEAAIVRGILTAGGSARSAGVITTPGVAYLTRHLTADAGVVLSASHNPFADNGIKIFLPSGRKLNDQTEAAIEAALNDPNTSYPPMQQGGVAVEAELDALYLDFLADEIGAGLRLNDLAIAVDCANGASYALAPALLRRLGATIIPLNVEPNGRNINLHCGSLHPETLQAAVQAHGAQVGVAFDGDADRLLLVDETGAVIDGDQVLFIVAEALAKAQRLQGQRVVATVMSNLGLEVALRERGISLTRTSVGDKYVLEELLANGGSIGGEQSGHIIFPEISLAGDGLISALQVLRVMTETGAPLSQLASGFTRFPQVTINVNVQRKPPLESLPALQALITATEHTLAERGRVLVRYSGTENKARVMLEGADEAVIQQQAQAIARELQQQLN